MCSFRVFGLLFLGLFPAWAFAQAPVVNPRIHQKLGHDATAFTQGLAYHQDGLFESTGVYGRSQIRELDPLSLEVIRQRPLSRHLFGEGLALIDQTAYQLTWKAGLLLRYALPDFIPQEPLRYRGEGWGLTIHDNAFVMSDGSDVLSFRRLSDFTEFRQVRVTDDGKRINLLNELEVVEGYVWANVWKQPRIAVIDPDNGSVRLWIDLSALIREQNGGANVANGIAWQKGSDKVLVTGKFWSHSYLIDIPSLD